MFPVLAGKFFFFKKIRDTKGTFHAKMDTIKDKNGMDLTEAGKIKKRWQEYTELYITMEAIKLVKTCCYFQIKGSFQIAVVSITSTWL